jgi:hypothetical protein
LTAESSPPVTLSSEEKASVDGPPQEKGLRNSDR